MKKLLLILFSTSFALANAGATLFFSDGFGYTSGELLAPTNGSAGQLNPGGNNWFYAGANTANTAPPSIASSGLSYNNVAGYSGFSATTGNSVSFDMTKIGSARIQVTSGAVSAGTVYWSGLLRIDTIGTLTTGANGMLLGGFNNTPGAGTLPTSVGAVLRIRTDTSDPTVYHIGTAMQSGTGAGNVQFANSLNFSAGNTVFVVASYEFVAGSFNDVGRMWINPDMTTFGDASPPTATLTSAPGGAIADSFASLSTFNLRNVNTVGNPTVRIDELRVGDTWADVMPAAVPEPATAGLMGLGLLMAIGWYRFRK